MSEPAINVIIYFVQTCGLGIIIFITRKIFLKVKLNEIKLEALIFAIETESKNGFGEAYKQKLNELLKQENYLKV